MGISSSYFLDFAEKIKWRLNTIMGRDMVRKKHLNMGIISLHNVEELFIKFDKAHK